MAWGSGNVGGGTGGFNFKIVSAAIRPNNPSKNTIWIDTNSRITEWSFSPEKSLASNEGSVWIKTGTSEGYSFNALKKNSIVLNPQNVNMYLSGFWNNMDAYIYDGSKWIKFSDKRTFFYTSGVQNVPWQSYFFPNYQHGTANFNSSFIELKAGSKNDRQLIAIRTSSAFDMSIYSKICAEVSLTTNDPGQTFAFCYLTEGDTLEDAFIQPITQQTSLVELNINHVALNKSIAFRNLTNNKNVFSNLTIKRVWAE